ncbi:MAG: hypothetical protein Q7K33_04225 [Candidatus Berkelbacteria bacterium]|nr:hypothetical protein [Candidatus Berkelbacteria bacterium]
MSKQETSSFQKILVFNTTSRDLTSVALVVNGKSKKLVEPVRAQDLQKLTDELLKSAKTKIEQIDAVAVLTGPGSYTGTRMGVAAANTLGWLLDKPIIELEGDSLDNALEFLKESPLKPVTKATARY